MRNELSIYFENPATDPLGYEQVEGKLVCNRDGIRLRFKQKDRAFRKSDPLVIELTYSEVEAVTYSSKWFGPKLLTLRTRDTDKLKDFPGAEVSKVSLHVLKTSRSEATRAEDFVEYHQSEVLLREQDDRLSESRESLDL